MEFDLNTLWFFLITVLWVAYFFLEGFDFGVGILLPFLGKDDTDRRVMINTIGPVWDGNEVWLLVAGGATFAAFPEWYATLFSGFYLPLFLILVALIARGVAFEYRGKDKRPEWRAWFDRAIFFGSALPALLWGVAFANIVNGVPIDGAKEYTGNLFTLLNPYALVVGVTTFVLFTLHGAVFLALKAEGTVAEAAKALAKRLALPMAGLGVIVLVWTFLNEAGDLDGTDVAAVVASVLVALAAVGAVLAVMREREGWAFVGTGLTIVLVTVTLFLYLYPAVMPSTTEGVAGLDIYNASSTNMTLKVMTVVALIFTPIVLGYQAWSYKVFSKRISREQFTTTKS
ncbi:MAG: cytochrome d ubiquinol oxidase subunit II [Actinobacteria bacterium]|nr:cytochrome d ubiquinol oxidase subunit II [Actinomycetota bacterium]